MKLKFSIFILSIFTSIFIVPKAQAQITPTPNDANTIVNQTGNTFTITGGTQVDKNLFHSLQKFGLNENQIADFVTNPGTQNVLGRITGGDASVINGLIKITGSDANLYLMNPAGIIFGSGAKLDVPGSFTATTANGIGFGDNKWFNGFGDNNYAELMGEPNSFAFTMSEPGAIFNAGNLAVAKGESLNLLGGITINTGTLSSEGGNINVAAIPGQKLVRITQEGSLLSLGLPTSTANNLNPVSFNPLSLPQLLTGGNLNSATGITVENGIVKLTGSGVEIPNQSGTAIVSNKINTSGNVGGNVNILGEKVGVVSANINATGKNGGGTVLIGGDYKGEGIVPNAKITFISQDSVVKADAEDRGNGGKVIAWADQTTGFYGTISARGGNTSGDGGFVEVSGKENLIFRGSS
ncbi:MAG: filamentous hemagglutinin N-terminal domain-containing protein [Richelia sp. SM2_1_7]|nr:filamentous hemagglutinin N-terminal domain-containing protein [Richelia sp. SM2_1_7]